MTTREPPGPEQRASIEHRFALFLAAAVAALALAPTLLAMVGTPPGAGYLGYQFATDDHMVYSAWMRQAMDGRFFFDNRFTVDPQPALTVHLYFYALGLLASLVGPAAAATFARILFGFTFVLLAHRLIRRASDSVFPTKLALVLTVFGGGIGFLVWHTFGTTFSRPAPDWLAGPMLSRLPTDVWQPEGFVFPSMLVNGLFMVSLCLILVTFLCVLDSRTSWWPVLPGFLAFGLLMNIHSYDVLLVALVLVAFLVMGLASRTVHPWWVVRAVVIGLGAVPAAIWFWHVLQQDPVFQARAATPTFSPNFRALFFGYLPMLALGVVALIRPPGADDARFRWRAGGAGILVVTWLLLFVFARGHLTDDYFLGMAAWVAVLVATLAAAALLATDRPEWNLLVAWGTIGIVAPYFPALFQRKLAMGLSVPWAILAAFGLWALLARQDRALRNLVTVLAIFALCATSFRWFFRERELVRLNVSNTTVHSVYLTPDARRIAYYLNRRTPEGQRIVLVAPPGIPNPRMTETGEREPDDFGTPIIPDLNTLMTGLTGAYTFAGHWSETPDYLRRRGVLEKLYFGQPTLAEARAILRHTGATYLIAPVPEAFPGIPFVDFSRLGVVVEDGTQFRLIRVGR